ncbi:MAG TPA: tail fiber protein [Candidatus Baltobacteraceae bacterium]|jgi:microcystin-dependent protein|nr:tail fiber protein [Candidatus Baltobacteraceae bacterium]
MKRQAFVLSGAGAALAGCAGTALSPNSFVNSAARSMASVSPAAHDDQLLGSIMLFPYNFIPQHFEKCAGQILPVRSNPGLYSLLGNRFGGDGFKDFGLPDMRGHAPVKDLTYAIATTGIYPDRKRLQPRYAARPLLGELSLVAYRPKYTPPSGWATCNGQLLKIDHNGPLYALLGTTFGGDGETTFGLPDLREHELLKGITYVIALQGRFPLAR